MLVMTEAGAAPGQAVLSARAPNRLPDVLAPCEETGTQFLRDSGVEGCHDPTAAQHWPPCRALAVVTPRLRRGCLAARRRGMTESQMEHAHDLCLPTGL